MVCLGQSAVIGNKGLLPLLEVVRLSPGIQRLALPGAGIKNRCSRMLSCDVQASTAPMPPMEKMYHDRTHEAPLLLNLIFIFPNIKNPPKASNGHQWLLIVCVGTRMLCSDSEQDPFFADEVNPVAWVPSRL
jgi:hypothetical protein